MEEVLVSMRNGCTIERSGSGLYDLTLLQDGRPVESVRHVRLTSAARIATEWLGRRDEE